MKKFITVMLCTVILFTVADILYYRAGVYIDLNPEKKLRPLLKHRTTESFLTVVKDSGSLK